MRTTIIEVTNGPNNWGKFLVGRFEAREWDRTSVVGRQDYSLLGQIGWTEAHVWVLDLQTGEGACFLPGSHASVKADLDKHRIWVCPLYEPFLGWLYRQTDYDALPAIVNLPDAPFAMAGYRRDGQTGDPT